MTQHNYIHLLQLKYKAQMPYNKLMSKMKISIKFYYFILQYVSGISKSKSIILINQLNTTKQIYIKSSKRPYTSNDFI